MIKRKETKLVIIILVPITALKSDEIESVDPQNVERAPYQQHYLSQTKLDYAKREQVNKSRFENVSLLRTFVFV